MPTYNLQIVTPEREIFNAPVESATLPGLMGSFGVLANHAPLLAALEPGLVRIQDADLRVLNLFVGGGFFQVAHNQAMLLADSAEFASEINVDRARAAEQRALELLGGKLDEMNTRRDEAEAALKRSRARMRVASNR
jgi:F-type H+-transporting ATPase subunit epsilon